MVGLGKQPPRHSFFLNPYPQEPFHFCPKCNGRTEERKFPLLIHIDPKSLFCLGKTCPYCPRCDLIIAHQHAIEQELAFYMQNHYPDLVGNGYLTLGTLEVDVWKRGLETPLTMQEMTDNLHDFAAVLRFERAGPYRPPRPRQRLQKQDPDPDPRRSGVPPAVDSGRKPGRNAPCWCGSGKKYKNCHLRLDAS